MSNIKSCHYCKPPERFPGFGDYCLTYQDEKKRFKESAAKRLEENEINQYQRRIISINRVKSHK